MVLTLIALLGILSASSFAGSVFFHWRSEKTLPLTIMTYVLLLFFAGCARLLRPACAILAFGSVAAGAAAFAYALAKGTLADAGKRFFSVSYVAFVCVFFVIAFLNRRAVAGHFDEFSHWFDAVKTMTMLDDFNSSPLSHGLFKSYPPGMALFQYFLERIHLFLNPGAAFNEALPYVAYQTFCASLFMPLFKDENRATPLWTLFRVLVLLLLPSSFYEIYTNTHIEPFLCVLSGTGMAMILFSDAYDAGYHLHILLICAMLVLAKDTGLFLAVFLGLAYIAEYFCRKPGKTRVLLALLALAAAIAIPKLLWKRVITVSGVEISFDSANLKPLQVISQFLSGKGYIRRLVKEYAMALITSGIVFGYARIPVVTLLFMFVGLFVFINFPRAKRISKPAQKRTILVGLAIFIQAVVYIFGLVFVYACNFGESEALSLVSFNRYIAVSFCAVWIVIMTCFLDLVGRIRLTRSKMCRACALILIVLVLGTTQASYLLLTVSGYYPRKFRRERASFSGFYKKIEACAQPGDRVNYISNGSNGRDYYMTRYCMNPILVNGSYSIGETQLEGDVRSNAMTAEEWREKLMADFDYVAIYKAGESFAEQFGEVFANPEEISDCAVYRLNRETGLLEKVLE